MNNPSSAILHGCFGRLAKDASPDTNFHSTEWTLIRNRRNKGKKILKSNIGEYHWKTIPKQKVSFGVAPKGNKMTYPRINVIDTSSSVRQTKDDKRFNQEMKRKHMKKILKKAFEKILEEVKRQDEKLEEVNRTIPVTIKMLEEQLVNGIKIIKLQKELHRLLSEFETHRLKANIPLHKQRFERIFKIEELHEILDRKCQAWKQKSKRHNFGNYTFGNAAHGTMPNNPDIYYVDSSGYMDLAPPDDSTNFYASFEFPITFPLSHRQCRFIGRHRCCPSPPKRRHNCNYHVTSGSAARRRNEEIVNEAWSQKQKIRIDLQHANSPYTRIECAFAASSVSMTTAEEMDQDETSARKAAVALRSEIENIDAAVFSTTDTDTTIIDTIQDEQGKALAIETISKSDSINMQVKMMAQQNTIEQLTCKLDELRKECQQSTASVISHLSTVITGPNNPAVPSKIIETTTTPNAPEISYTMGALLDRYETLDKESRNENFFRQ
jgi:hypothetical protein